MADSPEAIQKHMRLYWGIFLALLMFTGLTIWVATVDLGSYARNLTVGMIIALAKASLVAALDQESDLSFGLATFPNQDGLYVAGKGGTGDRVELRSGAADPSCSGWEPNDDESADGHEGHSLKWPTRGAGPPSQAVGDLAFVSGVHRLYGIPDPQSCPYDRRPDL